MNAPDLLPTSAGDKTAEEIVDLLTYVSYSTQRDNGMSAAGAATLYRNAEAYEARYQAELAHEAEVVRDGRIYVDEGYTEDLERCRESLREEP